VAGFLSGMGGAFGTEKVVIIRDEGGQDETRTETVAHIQAESGFFEVDTPIYEGDIVELDDPRGGRERRLVRDVQINNPRGASFRSMAHIQVKWGKAPAVRSAPVRRLSVKNFHSKVIEAAGDLFSDQHYASAVSEAFKSIEVRVRELAQISDKSGAQLMGEAFGTKTPKLDVAPCSASETPRHMSFLSPKTRNWHRNTSASRTCCTADWTSPNANYRHRRVVDA
jgi:uncharacterized protein (TIGR02391 family)